MRETQAEWLDSALTALEAFLNNEQNNPDDRTISDQERGILWSFRTRLINTAAQIREDDNAPTT